MGRGFGHVEEMVGYQRYRSRYDLVRRLPYGLDMKSPRTLLLTAAFVVAPIVGVGIILYGLGHAAVGRRSKPAKDPYKEWLALRQLVKARGGRDEAAPGASQPAAPRS